MIFKISKKWLILLILCTPVISQGCKLPESADSKSKSLDNFALNPAVNDFVLNSCSTEQNSDLVNEFKFTVDSSDPRKPKSKKTKSEFIEEYLNSEDRKVVYKGFENHPPTDLDTVIEDVLKVTPLPVLDFFFSNKFEETNKIYIWRDIAKPCLVADKDDSDNTNHEKAAGAQPFSCYSARQGLAGVHIGTGKVPRQSDDNTTQSISVDHVKAIRHGLMKAIIFFDTFAKQRSTQSDSTAESVKNLKALVDTLRNAIAADLRLNKIGNPESVERDENSGWPALTHAIESASCSVTTRAIFNACFPNAAALLASNGQFKAFQDQDTRDQRFLLHCQRVRLQAVQKTWGSQ